LVTKKVSSATRASSAPRHRAHSLAPEHLGEVGSVAVLTMAILGLSVFIGAVAMIASGVTMGSRYTGATPPPNLADLGMGQVVGGVGLLILGAVQAASALALLAAVRGSRRITMLVAAGSAVLTAAGVVLVMGQQTAIPLLAGALAIATVLYGASAVILARPRR
jgi:hypothetical protein